MLDRRPDWWLVALIAVSTALITLVNFVLVYRRTKALRKSLADTNEPTVLALRSIKVATVGTVVLAIVASGVAVSLNRLPKDWLTGPNIALAIGVLALTFVVPTVVAISICYSVASTDDRRG
jgi:hypothetical protein